MILPFTQKILQKNWMLAPVKEWMMTLPLLQVKVKLTGLQ